ncbi:putative uncharacterized protein [Clostridium sp. CAG:433]|nr:putative uncharacterized protein [Clostridium sp. CAG:433]
MKKYNILFASHPDYSGNAKAIYEYMKENYKEYNLYYLINDESNYELLKSAGVDCYINGSDEFKKLFDKIDIVFFTHDELLEMKKPNQIYIYLGHGNSGKRFGHLLSENQLAVQDKRFLELMKENIDCAISTYDLWSIIYHCTFDIDFDRILPIGTPRTDYIHISDGKSNLKKCGIDTESYDKVLMYLPTFRNGLGRENDGAFSDNILNLEKYNEEELENYLEDNNYLLIIKYHPYEINKKNITNMKNIVVLDDSVMTKNLVTLTEVINGIDLIVADYSSAFSDFVILDRPVCFLDNDIELYKKNRGITFDNIKFWSPGPFIKGLNEFVDEVKKLLNNKDYYKEERKNYVDMNFGKNIENCSKNVADYLFKDNNIQKFFDKKKKTADSKLIELYGENLNLKDKLDRTIKNCDRLEKENEMLDLELRKLKDDVYNKKNELDNIYSSRAWKFSEKIRHIIRKK